MARRQIEEVGIDMTPMIDVVFQLIIFFIVTVQMDQESVIREITLPPSVYAKEQKGREGNQVTIQIDRDGKMYLGSSQVQLNTIEMYLKGAVRRQSAANMPVLIRADSQTLHKNVRRVMDTCSKVGIYQIRFASLKREPGKVPK